MGGPRNCCTESSKSDKKRQIPWYCLYVESKHGTNELIYKTEIESQMLKKKKKQTYGYRGERRRRDKLGNWDGHIHTAIYETDK